MKRCKQKSPEGHQVLRSSSKKVHQKNPDSKNAALDAPSPPTAVPQRPPAPRASFEDTVKVNLPSTPSYSIKDLCPDPNIKKVKEPDVFKKNPLSQSMTKSDSELPMKEVKVKQEKLSPTIDRKKRWKLSYLESSQKECQQPEVKRLEHNFNNGTNSKNNGSKKSTVVIKKEYDSTPPPQSVPIKTSARNHTLSNSDICPANRPVLNSTVPNITDYSSTCVDLSQLISQNSSSYLQNNNTLQTSWSNDKKLQNNSKKLEAISIQTPNNPGKQLSQAPLEGKKSAVSNSQNLEIPNYIHNDSCLKNESHPEVIQNLPPIEKMLLPIQTHSSQGYDNFMPSQRLGHTENYNNFVAEKTSHDSHPSMTMEPPRTQQPNVPSYLYRRPEITYGSSMASYPQQPIPQSSAMCWNQNQPVHENGTIPGLMTQVSDGNLMPGHLIKNQPQGGYFVHSILPSPSAHFSFIPNQNPSTMGSALSSMTVKAPPKGTMMRMPMDQLPESFIPTAETSAFPKSTSSECHDFNPGNNEDYSQGTQLLDKPTKLVNCNRTTELFGVFHDFQIPKSMNGVIKGRFILRNYIDFLIWENEEITEMSQEYTPPTPLYTFAEDQYILKAATDNALFPTSKFERFIEIHFPSIDLHMIDFGKCKGSIYIPRKLDTDVDKIQDVFFYFQNLRGTNSNMTDTEISDDNNIAEIELSFTNELQQY